MVSKEIPKVFSTLCLSEVLFLSLWALFKCPWHQNGNAKIVWALWECKALKFLIFKNFFLGVQLIYNFVLVSGVQKSYQLYTYMYPLFPWVLLPCRLLQSSEQGSLHCTIGPYCLSVLHVTVGACQPSSPNLSLSKLPLGEGNDSPLHYSCLGNPMDRGAWRVTVYGVTKRWTWLSD